MSNRIKRRDLPHCIPFSPLRHFIFHLWDTLRLPIKKNYDDETFEWHGCFQRADFHVQAAQRQRHSAVLMARPSLKIDWDRTLPQEKQTAAKWIKE